MLVYQAGYLIGCPFQKDMTTTTGFQASLHSMELQLGAVVSWVQEAHSDNGKGDT